MPAQTPRTGFAGKAALFLAVALTSIEALVGAAQAAQAQTQVGAAASDRGAAWLAQAMAAQQGDSAPAEEAQAEAPVVATESAADPAPAQAWAPREVRASGVRPPWMEERFTLTIQDHPLPEVLTEFAAAAGAPLRVGESVPQNARVNARFENVAGAEFLDRVARDHGLDWRYDGGMIEVSSIADRVTRLVALKGVSIIDLERAMRRLEIWEDKFRPKVVDGAIAHMNGPPRYVAAMETVLEEMVVSRAQAEAQRAAEEAQAKAQADQAAAEAKAAEDKAKADFEAEQAKLKAQYEAEQAQLKQQAEEAQRRAEAEAREQAYRAAQPPRVVRGGSWR